MTCSRWRSAVGGVVPALDEREHLAPGVVLGLERLPSDHLALEVVEKKLSAIALSYASPTDPVDGLHARLDAAVPERDRCVLAALVGVMHDA